MNQQKEQQTKAELMAKIKETKNPEIKKVLEDRLKNIDKVITK